LQPRAIRPFPTRRSSDLFRLASVVVEAAGGAPTAESVSGGRGNRRSRPSIAERGADGPSAGLARVRALLSDEPDQGDFPRCARRSEEHTLNSSHQISYAV